MIHMLKTRNREYKVAWFLKSNTDMQHRVRFRYKIINELKRSYSQPIRNLITARNSFVIETNYMHDFEIGDYVFLDYACNEKFKITNCAIFQHTSNEQSLSMLKKNPLSYWVLELR